MAQKHLQISLEKMVGDHALLTVEVCGDKYDFYVYNQVYEGYVKPMIEQGVSQLTLLQSACYSFCNGELIKNRAGNLTWLVERVCELEAELEAELSKK